MEGVMGKKKHQHKRSLANKSKKKLEKELLKQGLNRHHRQPKAHGGDKKNGNISWVDAKRHRAWHHLFGSGHPVISVAAEINARWICLSEVLVPIPTKHLKPALALLASHGYLGEVTLETLGLTADHATHHGAPPVIAEVENVHLLHPNVKSS
jgi:hypothetical protein